jgi:TBC1 domain family member 10
VGYCQGMGFIAGLFLTYMSEEDAFYMFYAALQRSSAPLRLLYLPRLTETKKVLFVFEKLCEMHLPQLWAHLTGEGMHPTMFFTEWMMCIFCRGFSFELVTRVWDIFLHEGNIKIVYRVSLAILKVYDIALHAF